MSGSHEELLVLERIQRAAEPGQGSLVARQNVRVRIPVGGRLPRSESILESLYRDGFIAREKKPMVVDTRRSAGPYLASIDDSPLVVLDACSQIATLTHGFANRWLIRELYERGSVDWLWSNPDTTLEPRAELSDYAQALLENAPTGLEHVCFTMAGGAEANEKALRLARLHGSGSGRRVLAFRGGFHGRTLATLMATWNPHKRGPFELDGFEAIFAEPTMQDAAELLAAHRNEIYAVLVEPMMAEGGDIHLSAEFLRGLRTLTREHGVPLIVDEVQTGFGTGGTFLWWTRVVGDDCESPDLVTLAKKAQLGVVLSRWADPEPAPVHVASVVRGMVGLRHLGTCDGMERHVSEMLENLGRAHSKLLSNPRVRGTTFAFDLPTGDDAKAFIDQRLQRGFMTYPAGERTIRFRLNASWSRGHIEDLFARIDAALRLLYDPGRLEWQPEGTPRKHHAIALRPVEPSDAKRIQEIEEESYEPVRRSPQSLLNLCQEHGYAFVAYDLDDGTLLGCAFAAPIELFPDLDGPRQDPTRGRYTTLYSADVTVAPAARGRGVGRALKRHQLEWARDHGFSSVVGRNKVGATDTMMSMVRSFGAYVVARYEGQYDGESSAEYYRIPLRMPPPAPAPAMLDLASGIQRPMGSGPASLQRRELIGPAVCRLNLSNYATLDTAHYLDHLRLVLPRGMAHTYVTTSRDETVDKSLRCLRLSRTSAQIAVGLEGGYVGHTTAAARSISDPAGFGAGFGLYEWPRVPHPARSGVEAMLVALDQLVRSHGSERLFGVYAEVVGERSGLILEGRCAIALRSWCSKNDVPLVLVETASGFYRSGFGPWGIDSLPSEVEPDVVLWHPGGQLGHVFCGDRYWVATPLTLISTWDGEELSIIRAHEVWRTAHKLDLAPSIDALSRLVESIAAREPSARSGGKGLYRTVAFDDQSRAADVRASCEGIGLQVAQGAPGVLVFAPPLDVSAHPLNDAVGRLETLRSAAS